jgi:hypothetical protein
MKTQRGDDILVMERELAFAERLEDYFKNYEGERGQRWQEERNEDTQLEQATPPPPLPNNLE